MALRLLFLLIFISIIKGGIPTAVKVGLDELPPMGFIGWRNLIAAAALALGALSLKRYRNRETWWPSAGVGPPLTAAILLAVTMILFMYGMVHTSASRATVVSSTQPLFVLVLARLFLPGERITLAKSAGLALGLGGIALLISGGHVQPEGRPTLLGDSLVLCGTLVWAIQSIYEKKILPRYRPFTLVYWQIVFTAVAMLILWAVLEGDCPTDLKLQTRIAFLYMVIPVTIFVYPVYMYVLQYVEVSRISHFNFVMTASGVILGVALLREPITLPLILSVLLVSGGVILVMRSGGGEAPRQG